MAGSHGHSNETADLLKANFSSAERVARSQEQFGPWMKLVIRILQLKALWRISFWCFDYKCQIQVEWGLGLYIKFSMPSCNRFYKPRPATYLKLHCIRTDCGLK
jgi:hypothetical protein